MKPRTKRGVVRRHKTCAHCHVEFCDISSRPECSTCCSKKCAKDKGVSTRRKNGSYRRTEEMNRLSVETFRKNNGSHSDVARRPDVRSKISAAVKEAWRSGRAQSATIKSSTERWGVSHWTKSAQGRETLSMLNRGRRVSDDARKRMARSASARIRSKRETYTSARGGIREDIGSYFRSNWEANYARILNYEHKLWRYEPDTFETTVGTYTPDFSVDGVDGYIEVKGRIDDVSMKKVRAFIIEHPDVPITLIGPKEYDELRKKYQKLINWEGK